MNHQDQLTKNSEQEKPNSQQQPRVLAFGKIPAKRRYELFMERYRSAAAIIKSRFLASPGSKAPRPLKILDVGCGEGYLHYFLSDIDAEWYGIEQNPVRAERCRELGYQVLNVDITEREFPWEDETFDVVVASHVIEHLAAVEMVLKECSRVLAPDGVLIIGTPTKPPFFAEIMQWFRRLFSYDVGDTMRAYSSRSLVNECLAILGWSKATVIDVRGFRIISARKYLPLEDWRWYYKLSTFLSRHLLWLVPEVNVVFAKPKKTDSTLKFRQA